MRYVDGDYPRPRDLQVDRGPPCTTSSRHDPRTTWPSRPACSRPSSRVSAIRGLRPRTRGASSSRSLSGATWRRRRMLNRVLQLGVPRAGDLPPSTTTSARRQSRTCCTSGSPTRSSRPIWNRKLRPMRRPDHDGRELRRPGPRPLLRGGRRGCATLVQKPPPPDGKHPAMGGRPVGGEVESLRNEKEKVFSAMRHAQATRTWCEGSSTATATRTASRRTRTSRRTPQCGCSSTRGVGNGVPFFIRAGKGPAGHRPLR